MKSIVTTILNDLKALKIPTSRVEKELGVSNGLLGKAAKGNTVVSDAKFKKLVSYWEKKTGKKYVKPELPTTAPSKEILKQLHPSIKIASEVPPPVVLNRAVLQSDIDNKETADRFRALCKVKKTNVEDMFVWLEENYGKKPNPISEYLRSGSSEKKESKTPISAGVSKLDMVKMNNDNFFSRVTKKS